MPTDATGDWVDVATVLGAYGVKGWIRLSLNLQDYSLLIDTVISLRQADSSTRQHSSIVAIRPHGKAWIAKVAGVDDRTDAEVLRGAIFSIKYASLPELAPDDFYWHELEGLKVVCYRGSEVLILGKIHYLLDTGANDVAVIRPSAESIDGRERLIPWIRDYVVKNIDVSSGVVEVDWHVDD